MPDLVLKEGIASVDELFDQVFKVLKSSAMTYQVSLKMKNEDTKKFLRDFAKYLHRSKGMTQHTVNYDGPNKFYPVAQSDYDKAVRLFKEKLTLFIRKQGEQGLIVIDFKYASKETYTSPLNEKSKPDVKKQLVYEWALTLNGFGDSVRSRFCIPKFFPKRPDTIGVKVKYEELNPFIKEKRISVVEWDYERLKDAYLAID